MIVPFPLAALPPWLREMVEATAAFAQAEVGMAAAAALGVLSGAVGRKGFVRLGGAGGRRFPLHVWLMVIGESGDGKSTVFNELGSPLRSIQSLPEDDSGERALPPAETVHHVLMAPGDPWERVVAPPPARLADAVAVVRDALAAAGNPPLRLLLDDITPTTLIDVLGSQVTGAALISPEGGFETWLTQGGSVASQNAATLNRAWDGEDFTRERQDRIVRVARPALTLLVGVQPDIFKKFASDKALRSRGFTLRFLFTRSEALRRVYPAPEIAPEVRSAYEARIYQLACLPGWPPHEPISLLISDGAAQLNADFLNRLEGRIHVGGDLQHGRAYGKRFGSNLPRVAALLHLARHIGTHGDAVVELPVDEETMVAAVEVATYLVEEGVAALTPQPRSNAGVSLVQAIERLLAEPPSWVGTPDDLCAVLQRLVPASERATWPEGANNLMRLLRDRTTDLLARGITLREERTSAVRMVLLSRTERGGA